MSVRVRIAPSPTGDPHVGTAYVALFNLAFARSKGGAFILRIEDTDRARSTRESEEAIFRSLKWLGLRWDEGPDVGGPLGPYRQSERLPIYRDHARILLEKGAAYPCFCADERLKALREQQQKLKVPTGYDGLCRRIDPAEAKARAAGAPHVLRLKVPREGTTAFADLLRGEIRWENALIDDQVLLKSDGFPTYHLANVVDDRLMEITHVIRGEEWIPSTPKHILLYDALRWKPPVFAHLPLLRNPDKSKVSKRKNPCSLTFYEKIGILPEALVNFLGLMGYSLGENREVFAFDDLVKGFDLSRIGTGGPVFDLAKLKWLNGHYLRRLPPEELARRLAAHAARWFESFAPLLSERLKSLSDFEAMMDYCFKEDLDYPVEGLVPKGTTAGEIAPVLKDAAAIVEEIPWKAEPLEARFTALAAERALKPADLFMTLRVAMTGRKATPPLFQTMALLDRFTVLTRLREAARRVREEAGKG